MRVVKLTWSVGMGLGKCIFVLSYLLFTVWVNVGVVVIGYVETVQISTFQPSSTNVVETSDFPAASMKFLAIATQYAKMLDGLT